MGGIARTVNYRGNRIDIGGHRFFSKSDRAVWWWLDVMPLQPFDAAQEISYRNQRRTLEAETPGDVPAAKEPDLEMLVRQRKSRIYFLEAEILRLSALTNERRKRSGSWDSGACFGSG